MTIWTIPVVVTFTISMQIMTAIYKLASVQNLAVVGIGICGAIIVDVIVTVVVIVVTVVAVDVAVAVVGVAVVTVVEVVVVFVFVVVIDRGSWLQFCRPSCSDLSSTYFHSVHLASRDFSHFLVMVINVAMQLRLAVLIPDDFDAV